MTKPERTPPINLSRFSRIQHVIIELFSQNTDGRDRITSTNCLNFTNTVSISLPWVNAYIIDDCSFLLSGACIHEFESIDSISAIDSQCNSGDSINDGPNIQYFNAVEIDLK